MTTVLGRHLRPGMVILFGKDLALVISQDIPAKTMPEPKNAKFCEPGLVILKHQRDDRWVQTHHFTYALFLLDYKVKVNDSVRVRYPDRFGKFLSHADRLEYKHANSR